MRKTILLTTGLLFLLLLVGSCVTITGEIRDNKFYLENDFIVDILDNDWEIVRQKVHRDIGIMQRSNYFAISFNHKKSNGVIGINSFELSDVEQARTLDIHLDDAIADLSGMKLAQKNIKIDGNDAIEAIISSKYMFKYIYLKKGKKGFVIIYRNTSTYFDQYLGVFDRFVETLKIL